MVSIKAEVIIEQRLSRDSLPFMAWAANEMGTDAKMFARLSTLYDKECGDDAREFVGVRVSKKGPKALEFLKKLEPYVGIKREVRAAVDAADEGMLFEGKGHGLFPYSHHYNPKPKDAAFWRAIDVRNDLVTFCEGVKTEAGQLSEDELRARMPYRRTGVVDVERLGAYFGGLVSGDACASRGALRIAQSYKAFLNVVSEDLNAAFGTDFRVYEKEKTENSKKTPFEARSSRTAANEAGNKKLARAALRNMPMCDESKRAALQRVIDGAAK